MTIEMRNQSSLWLRIPGLIVFMGVLAGVAGDVTAQQRYSLSFQDAELATVMEIFEAVLDQTINVEPELIRNKRVTLIELPSVTAEGIWDVLGELLAQHDLVLTEIEADSWQIEAKSEPAGAHP